YVIVAPPLSPPTLFAYTTLFRSLQVTRRGSDFVQRIGEFRTRALAVLSVSALLVLIIVWMGYQRAIGRHIQAMGGSMAHIASGRSEEHTSELQSRENLVCRLLLE